MPIKRAILSVYNKAGLVDLARALAEHGVALTASGGTAAELRGAGLIVQDVSQITHSPEILDGRVKTLHPAIHGGILSRRTPADRQQLQSMGWEEIDLVVVNLQPFEKTAMVPATSQEEIIERIDIGGMALLSAAAMNFRHVTTVCYPADYATIINDIAAHGDVPLETRRKLAARAFARVAAYSAAIQNYLAESDAIAA